MQVGLHEHSEKYFAGVVCTLTGFFVVSPFVLAW